MNYEELCRGVRLKASYLQRGWYHNPGPQIAERLKLIDDIGMTFIQQVRRWHLSYEVKTTNQMDVPLYNAIFTELFHIESETLDAIHSRCVLYSMGADEEPFMANIYVAISSARYDLDEKQRWIRSAAGPS